ELVAFAAHRLDQDAKVQFAAAADDEAVRLIAVLDAQGDVLPDFVEQALAQAARGAEADFAFAPRKRGCIDAEGHADSRFFDRNRRQAFRDFGIANGVADLHRLEAAQRDDIA